jgi:hypothetical protein
VPFTHSQFLDLFGSYNAQFAPVVAALWLVSVLAVLRYFRGELATRPAAGLLAVHWAWSGVVYHAAFFTRINPAAWLFAALFVIQAGAFAWLARAGRLPDSVPRGRGVRRLLADAFLLAAVAYPLLVLMTDLALPRAPLFAVPCPTTLFTTGLLLALGPLAPRWLAAIPVAWAAVGGSAALALGVLPDYLLIAAGASLVALALLPSRRRQAAPEAAPAQRGIPRRAGRTRSPRRAD